MKCLYSKKPSIFYIYFLTTDQLDSHRRRPWSHRASELRREAAEALRKAIVSSKQQIRRKIKWDICHHKLQEGKKSQPGDKRKKEDRKGSRVELELGKRRRNVMMERTRERVLKKSVLKNNNHVMAWLVSPYLTQWTGKWEEDREEWFQTDGKEKETKVSEWTHLNWRVWEWRKWDLSNGKKT